MISYSYLLVPLMRCFLSASVVIHNALMKLAEAEDSNLDISPESINARYLKNNVIDYFSFDFSNISKPYEDFLTKFQDLEILLLIIEIIS